MAHQIESNYAFFARGFPAWHGIGTVFPGEVTIQEAAKTMYPGDVVKLQAAAKIVTPNGDTIYSDSDDHVAIVRANDGKFLSFMSKGYEIVQVSDSLEYYRPLLESGLVKLEAGGSLNEGKRFWLLAKIQASECEILPGDTVKDYLLFHGSFDGSLPTGYKETGVRVVCANTCAMALSGGFDMSSKHTKNTHVRLNDYRDQIQARLKGFGENVRVMRTLATKQVKRAAQVKYISDVFLTPAEQKQQADGELSSRMENKVRYVIDLLDTQRGLELVPAMRGTAWQAYNAVSQYLTHDSGRTADSRVNSQWFGANATLNNKAMTLAQAL